MILLIGRLLLLLAVNTFYWLNVHRMIRNLDSESRVKFKSVALAFVASAPVLAPVLTWLPWYVAAPAALVGQAVSLRLVAKVDFWWAFASVFVVNAIVVAGFESLKVALAFPILGVPTCALVVGLIVFAVRHERRMTRILTQRRVAMTSVA